MIIGLVNTFAPSFAWYIKEGWKVDGDSEPSEAYLSITRFGGIIAIIIGIILFLAGLSSS
ncbi:DUF6199 family natural product biosynthesis protein [Paenibacillus senegalimassiliensis]|uniref:DUF6199 family natural product biosynthesis protein n=1 Tax=Paenibacillus senegalimassiliensis TaxID=1737426 RepID=UPI00073E3CFC|nr:DUF6199 family natural product biosynthesis protein [Paenibacillus senegalimassiliensis]